MKLFSTCAVFFRFSPQPVTWRLVCRMIPIFLSPAGRGKVGSFQSGRLFLSPADMDLLVRSRDLSP